MNTSPEISPTCRAERSRWFSSENLAICLTTGPCCQHRLNCDEFLFCLHPDRQQIIAQTQGAKNPATSVA